MMTPAGVRLDLGDEPERRVGDTRVPMPVQPLVVRSPRVKPQWSRKACLVQLVEQRLVDPLDDGRTRRPPANAGTNERPLEVDAHAVGRARMTS